MVGIIGNGPHVPLRAEAIRAVEGVTLAEHLPEATAAGVIQRQEAALDVVLVCGSAGRRVEVAEAALRQGRHVFLEWPPAASVRELERLAERAEEAGAEVGVSRPLRFHPLFDTVPETARVDLASMEDRATPDREARWTARLTDALDLCSTLAGRQSGAGVRRLDAQAVRTDGGQWEAVSAGLRFHSGTYATLTLRTDLCHSAPPARRLYVAGSSFRLEADLDRPVVRTKASAAAPADGEEAAEQDVSFRETLLRRETQAFLQALDADQPAPVSVLDALAAMRLTERLMQQLR